MALDGFVVANVVSELRDKLVDGRISKISQPEKDELVLTIKRGKDSYKLYLSANASLPLIYLTEESKQNPMVAPSFCMLLRKHLNSARILDILQPGLERIILIKIEHLNEMGDLCIKYLIIEIMGKHSNIIFCDENEIIVDSIKRISHMVSSLREVLPGRTYVTPKTGEKADPLTVTFDEFKSSVLSKPMPLDKAIYSGLTGFSPLMASELIHRASLDFSPAANGLTEEEGLHLFRNFEHMREDLVNLKFTPNIVYSGKEPVEFSCFPLSCYKDLEVRTENSVSRVLETFYSSKNTVSRIRQKSTDLRKIITNAMERAVKKYDLQLKQLKDTDKRDKYRIYGELINTYGYQVEPGAKSFQALNYYSNEEITIPLDETLTPAENAKRYFEKYNKLKRTYEALTKLSEETRTDIEHLDSIKTSLDIALAEEDLAALKEELMEFGYMKRKFLKAPGSKGGGKAKAAKKVNSKPFHYISSDGFHMYVGKNNYQNDELTFKFATGGDWWFHTKKIPGSHVIVKANGSPLPDRTFEEAASLAAYYSKGRENDKVEIDYTEKKNVKKPGGAKPGFVVYYTNYSMVAPPSIEGLKSAD